MISNRNTSLRRTPDWARARNIIRGLSMQCAQIGDRRPGPRLAALLIRRYGRRAERALIRARQVHAAHQPDRERTRAMHRAYRRRGYHR